MTQETTYQQFQKPTAADYATIAASLRRIADGIEMHGDNAESVRIEAIALASRCNRDDEWGALFCCVNWHSMNEPRTTLALRLREVMRAVMRLAGAPGTRPTPDQLRGMANDIEARTNCADADSQRRQRGVELRRAGMTWPQVAVELGGVVEDEKAVAKEIREYARATSQEMNGRGRGRPRKEK